MKYTPLHPVYAARGARLVDFAGWELPVQFSGIPAEHCAVRTGAGLFDVSHMGEFLVTGRDSRAFLQYVLTNDCAKLTPGRVLYSPMCYPDGGCVDDLLVYMFGTEEYLLVVNAANTEKDLGWLLANSEGYAVEVKDLSAQYAQLALQGPAASSILEELVEEAFSAPGYYRFVQGARVAGRPALISRTGYTGEDGFEFYVDPHDAIPLWEAILDTNRAVPAGLGARDTLRLEAGLPLYGHELSPSISPLEAGLDRFVALDKPAFIGRDALRSQAADGPPRMLVGLVLDVRGVPRAGCQVCLSGREIGAVTSGTLSPHSNLPIALALLDRAQAGADGPLTIVIRDKEYPAHRVPLPFYTRRRN